VVEGVEEVEEAEEGAVVEKEQLAVREEEVVVVLRIPEVVLWSLEYSLRSYLLS
jgi:hypothetical protein